MIDGLRELLLGNWRNKGVAMFFAVTIWIVAYQSEKQEHSAYVRVEFRPADPEATVITSIKHAEGPASIPQDFDGRIRVVFSGPRKQIDKIKGDPPVFFPLEVERDKKVHSFTQEDLDFPRDGVEVTQFLPESVTLVQEDLVTRTIANMEEKTSVSNLKEGYEVAFKEVTPGSVQLTGPRSIVDAVGVSANVSLEYLREQFSGRVEVQRIHPEDISADLVRRTVKTKPSQVNVQVRLHASVEVLPVEAVRVTFRLPPVRVAVKILLDDTVGDTIPVEFYGRKDEIGRLRERLRLEPGFSLGVRVPSFDRELGGQFTFTEDALELHGFPGVQIRQHESRRKDKKTAWSYTVVPVRESER